MSDKYPETSTLGDHGTFFRGKGGNKSDESPNGIPCIRYGDLYTHHDCIIKSFKSAIHPTTKSKYTLLKAGDTIFAASGETYEEIGKGATFNLKIEAYAGGDTIIFRPDGSLDPIFVGYAANSAPATELKSRLGQGSSVIHISAEHLSKIPIWLSTKKPEQQKIARILQTVDRAMEKTEALIEKYQQIKAGLMHDLFTRGLWTQEEIDRGDHQNTPAASTAKPGQLRPPRHQAPHLYQETPIGWIPRAWDGGVVKDFGNVKLGRQRSPKFLSGKWTTPYLRVANVFDGFFDFGDILQMDFTPNERETFSVREGDIFLNEGQSLELVGRCALYTGQGGLYCFQNTLIRFRPDGWQNPHFYRQLFKYYLDRRRFIRIAKQTTSVAHLGSDRFAKMACPKIGKIEQAQIADSLGLVDERIAAEKKLLTKLQKLKSGLMHDLLTGKVPVTPDPETPPSPANDDA